MNTYARTYWFTWAFLVIAAALTGVASLKSAFFGGLFAALLSALLSKVYERAGPRYAPLIGATAGPLWVIAMYFRIRWFGSPEDFEMAQWTLGTDISVHAAGFAGAALMTALRVRFEFPKAFGGGLLLAAAMTVVHCLDRPSRGRPGRPRGPRLGGGACRRRPGPATRCGAG